MPVCGCGDQQGGGPPTLIGGDFGIIVSGTFDDTIVSASGAMAWRPLALGAATGQAQLVNFTLGNGTYSGRFLRDGYNVDLIMSFRFGTTSTWAATQFEVNVPWNPVLNAGIIVNHDVLGQWSVFDSSTTNWWRGSVIVTAGGNLAFRTGDDLAGTNTTMLQGQPITFASGDELNFIVRYQSITN